MVLILYKIRKSGVINKLTLETTIPDIGHIFESSKAEQIIFLGWIPWLHFIELERINNWFFLEWIN